MTRQCVEVTATGPKERSPILLCQGGVELSHVVQRGFDSQQLLEDNQRKRQVDDVLVVESQTTQDAEQEVRLQLLFGLSSRSEERREKTGL